MGIPVDFGTLDPYTKVYTLYNAPSVPANRYTIQKITPDNNISDTKTATFVTPTTNSGVFIIGRANTAGESNNGRLGFTFRFGATDTFCGFSTLGSSNTNVLTLKIIVNNITTDTTGISIPSITSSDRLAITYDGTNFNYFVNGVMIHTVPSTDITVGTTKLYGNIYLASTTYPSSIVDFQMGNYDIGTMPNFIIGGKRNNISKKIRTQPLGKSRTRRLALTNV
jgi:hypothetical protein